MKKIIALCSMCLLLFACGEEPDVYLFSYFEGNGDGLHFAYSYDGLKWDAVQDGKVFLTPDAGKEKLMRDPSIAQGPDGVYHMVWTPGWTGNGIAHASSTDLIHWSEQEYLPLMGFEPNINNTWAPEVFWNQSEQQFYIVWAASVKNTAGVTMPNTGTAALKQRGIIKQAPDSSQVTEEETTDPMMMGGMPMGGPPMGGGMPGGMPMGGGMPGGMPMGGGMQQARPAATQQAATRTQGGQQNAAQSGQQATAQGGQQATAQGGQQATAQGGQMPQMPQMDPQMAAQMAERMAAMGGGMPGGMPQGGQMPQMDPQMAAQMAERMAAMGGGMPGGMPQGGQQNAAQGSQQNAAQGGQQNAAQGGQQNAAQGSQQNAAQGGQQNAARGGQMSQMGGGMQQGNGQATVRQGRGQMANQQGGRANRQNMQGGRGQQGRGQMNNQGRGQMGPQGGFGGGGFGGGWNGGWNGGWGGGWDDGTASETSSVVLLPLEQNPYDQVLYYVTTRDFLSISETRVFYDPYFSVIDGAFIRHGEKFYMFMKNEDPDAKNIMVTSATRMTRFSIDDLMVVTGEYWAEGPSPLQVGEFVYVYFDKYTEKQYGAVRSADMEHWDDVSDRVSFPEGMRHGTAFKVKEGVLKKLLSAK